MGNAGSRAPPLPAQAKFEWKPLHPKECRDAIGEGLNVKALEWNDNSPWQALNVPGPAGWLSQNKDEVQSFEQFWEQINSAADSLVKNPTRAHIYILPSPDIPEYQVDLLREMLAGYVYPLPVVKLAAIAEWDQIPSKVYRWSKRPHMNVEDLYKTASVQAALKDKADLRVLLVVSAMDLYKLTEEREEQIVLSHSAPTTRCASMSLARLHQGFFSSRACENKAEKTEHDIMMCLRALKVASHEVLSVLLLKRCVYFNCNMNGAYLHELDQRSLFLCPADLRKFLDLTKPVSKMDPDQHALVRYDALKKAVMGRVPQPELDWLRKRIDFLNNRSNSGLSAVVESKEMKSDVEIVTSDREKREEFLKDGTNADPVQSADLTKWVIGRTAPITDTYNMGKAIGTPGAFGQAFLVTLKATGEERVVKVISKQKFHNDKSRADHFEQLRNEIVIMKTAKHPNIISFFAVYESVADISIVMEKCGGGELFDRIQELGRYSEQAASGVLRQIMEGIQYLHSQRIAHCDLKPDNFLFLTKAPDSPLKIIDFGMSKHVQRGTFLTKFRGTPYYVAPEVLMGKYSQHCDIWSFGVIMFVCLFGFPPFHGTENAVIFDKIEQGFTNATKPGYGPWFTDQIPASDSAKDLIAKCLSRDTTKRLTAAEVLDHPWFHGSASTTPTLDVVAKNLSSFIASSTFKMEVLAHLVDIMEKDELKSLGRVFSEIDVNGDGLISPEELIAAFKKQGVDDAKVSTKVTAMMRSADVDGDGSLSYDELLLASIQRKLGAKEERLWQAFCKFDTNLDGKISATEISKVLGIPVGDALAMVKEIDRNGDGQIDYDEFNRMMMAKEEQMSMIKLNPQAEAKTNKKRATYLQIDAQVENPETVDLTKWVIGKTPVMEDFYTLGKAIGTPGAFGQAYLVTEKKTGEEKVVKIISKQKFHDDASRAEHLDQLRNEIAIMRKAKHPNIVQFFRVFETGAFLAIIMECCRGGELFDKIQELGHYSEKAASDVLGQIMKGILYLHRHKIAHCDLKPDNFLFLEKKEGSPIKIIDFGMSKIMTPGQYLTKFRGTPYYVAPEVLKGKYVEHCDIWSFGVIMFICLFGFPPFHGSDNKTIFSKIEQGFTNVTKSGYGPYFPDSIPCSESAKDLIAKCLEMDVAKRLTAAEVLDHPWFNGKASIVPTIDVVIKNLSSFIAHYRFQLEVLAVMVEIVPKDELKALSTMFNQIDVNHDGRISHDELVTALKKQGVPDEKIAAKNLIKAADVDGDGSLSYNELLLASVHRKLLAKEERIWQAFCKFDRDMDGSVTAAEIAQVLNIPVKDAVALIKEVDLNSDGVISYQEFNKLMLVKEQETFLGVLQRPES